MVRGIDFVNPSLFSTSDDSGTIEEKNDQLHQASASHAALDSDIHVSSVLYLDQTCANADATQGSLYIEQQEDQTVGSSRPSPSYEDQTEVATASSSVTVTNVVVYSESDSNTSTPNTTLTFGEPQNVSNGSLQQHAPGPQVLDLESCTQSDETQQEFSYDIEEQEHYPAVPNFESIQPFPHHGGDQTAVATAHATATQAPTVNTTPSCGYSQNTPNNAFHRHQSAPQWNIEPIKDSLLDEVVCRPEFQAQLKELLKQSADPQHSGYKEFINNVKGTSNVATVVVVGFARLSKVEFPTESEQLDKCPGKNCIINHLANRIQDRVSSEVNDHDTDGQHGVDGVPDVDEISPDQAEDPDSVDTINNREIENVEGVMPCRANAEMTETLHEYTNTLSPTGLSNFPPVNFLPAASQPRPLTSQVDTQAANWLREVLESSHMESILRSGISLANRDLASRLDKMERIQFLQNISYTFGLICSTSGEPSRAITEKREDQCLQNNSTQASPIEVGLPQESNKPPAQYVLPPESSALRQLSETLPGQSRKAKRKNNRVQGKIAASHEEPTNAESANSSSPKKRKKSLDECTSKEATFTECEGITDKILKEAFSKKCKWDLHTMGRMLFIAKFTEEEIFESSGINKLNPDKMDSIRRMLAVLLEAKTANVGLGCITKDYMIEKLSNKDTTLDDTTWDKVRTSLINKRCEEKQKIKEKQSMSKATSGVSNQSQ